jgi:hypothetical protein
MTINISIHQILNIAAIATALMASAASHAAPPVDVTAYPELAPDALLPPIIAELRRTLKDPQSVRDFTLCPVTKVGMKNGRPVRWSVLLSFNAKNSYGGYEGIKMFAAVFRNGRLSGGIVSTQFGSNEGLEGLINNAVARKMANCPIVPDESIQQLMTGSSIYNQRDESARVAPLPPKATVKLRYRLDRRGPSARWRERPAD